MAEDTRRPHVAIISPANGATFAGQGGTTTVPVTVEAEDRESGLVTLNWRLGGERQHHMTFNPPVTTQVTRTRNITIPTPGRTSQFELVARAFDAAGNDQAHHIWVTVEVQPPPPPPVDSTPPTYTIISPKPDAKFGSLDGNVLIPIRGTAQDPSGVATVEWSLDNGPYRPASYDAGSSSWWAEVQVAGHGSHSLAFRFADNKGNATAAVRQFAVVSPRRFEDINDLINAHEYLRDLIVYAGNHVMTPAEPLTVDELKAVFYQPFEELTDPLLTAGNRPLSQARLGVEVLRQYLAAQARAPTTAVAVKQGAGFKASAALETGGKPAMTAPAVAEGLAAHWTFDEGQGITAVDSSANGNSLTLQGAAWAAGRSNGALFFDGVYGRAVRKSPTSLCMSREMSACAWICPQGPGSGDRGSIILIKEGEYAIGRTAAGAIQWIFANEQPGWTWVDTGFQAPQEQWTHIAVVYDGGSVMTYANGQKIHEFAGAGGIGNIDSRVDEIGLGGRRGIEQYFHGLMDEVRIYRRALSATEVAGFASVEAGAKAELVTESRSSALSQPASEVEVLSSDLSDGLLAHWTFDEGSGPIAADASGNGNNVELKGPAWTTGRIGGGLRFDGVDDSVSVPMTPRLKDVVNNFTISFWAFPSAGHEIDPQSPSGVAGAAGQRFAIGPRYGPDDHAGMGVSVGTNGVSVYEHSSGYLPALLVHEQTITGWTHIAVVYKDRQPHLYLNGKLVKTGLVSPKSFVHVYTHELGGMVYGYYQGYLDEVRIYDGPLSEEAIAALIDEYERWLVEAREQFLWAEGRYRLAAYQALLKQLGTSYEEIRLARGADAETRTELAERLGITLDPGRPDQLDTLFLQPGHIMEADLEKLFGLVDTTQNPLRELSTPRLQTWRLDHLRRLWQEQDFPTDPYRQDLLPVVDPDVIGVDDLRRPETGERSFDTWRARRDWVDARLEEFSGMTKQVNNEEVPDLGAMFARMYQPLPGNDITAWNHVPPTAFDQLRRQLKQGSDSESRTLALTTIQQDLKLTEESFARLLAIRDKDAAAAGDIRNEKVRDEEWQEVFSILTQAQKVALYPSWIAEEKAQGVLFGPRPFWISLREPEVGHWPPLLPPGRPLIDPDVVGLNDLPDSKIGRRARELWAARRERLAQIHGDLKQAREAGSDGFEAMLRSSLGHPEPGDPLQHDLEMLQDDLNSIDPDVVEEATKKITNDLHLTVEAFKRLMTIKAKDAQADPLKKPTAAEYAEIYDTLTQARKIKHEFPDWVTEEQNEGIPYWRARKARLPRWRAGAAARQGWQQALRVRSAASLVDPDVIGPDDLSNPVAGNAAFDIWEARIDWLSQAFDALKARREAEATPLAGLDLVMAETLGVAIDELLALAEQDQNGEDIEAALEQLQLSREMFSYLMRIRALATSADQIVIEPEWADVYHILVQVRKRREFAAWREVERQAELALTPDHFQLSDVAFDLPPWRAGRWARQEWQDVLRGRIDQAQAVADGLAEGVAAAEEETLPLLRDALVQYIGAIYGLDDPAGWLSQQLAIDVRTTASMETTRALQAIQTVQSVLFSLRTGRFATGHPTDAWKLAYKDPDNGQATPVSDDHFDEEWYWMGTHATWASAILAFYYPEQLLIPSLRQEATAAFQDFIKEIRTNTQVTPAQARQAAARYAGAVKDKLPAMVQNNLHYFTTEQLSQHQLSERRDRVRAVYDALQITDPHLLPDELKELFYFVPLQLALKLQQAHEYVAALDWYQTIYAYNLADKPHTLYDERKVYYGLELERNVPPGILARSAHWLQGELNPHALAEKRPNAYTRFTLLSLAHCFLDFGDAEFTHDTFESLGRARSLYENAQRLLFLPELQPPPPSETSDLIPPNPVQEMLRQRVEIQLAKLREGRNIAGMKRQIDLLTSLSGLRYLPYIGSEGQLIIPGARLNLRPTPYRFKVLLERSQQLVSIAQQMEAAFLAALEKRDAENYNLLKAGHDLQLARASEELQSRRIQEATLGVQLAQAQRQRAVVVQQQYNALSAMPLNQYEQQMIQNYQEAINYIRQSGQAGALAATLQGQAAFAGGFASYYSSVAAAASSFLPGIAPAPNVAAIGAHLTAGGFSIAAGALGLASGNAAAKAAILSSQAQVAQTLASIAGIYASHEWRKKEWEVQAAIAAQDIAIGNAQVQVAQAHVQVAEQERRVAQTQAAVARSTATFLANKFTNAELYEWMSGILGDVYRYFLQQATAMAQLAENQLVFERQDTPPRLIQANYWQTSSENGLDSEGDRRGLTGSARLLQDIHQLDQYAFRTDKRKLNLSQTFSLARLAPHDFEQFRQTGVLTFATPMAHFNQEFPGHYLRLIKGVRVSVVALVPTHHGIRATLTASGISRTIIGGDVFQEVVIRRDPELVALTSPLNASGVFELDPQPDMLVPFEKMGVDTFWQFEMPKAANPFDFRTIADVLITIDYTALYSFDYRQQVLKQLNPRISGERSFSFRGEFADAWYDLHNPEQTATPMAVTFRIAREDFPPNVENLKIEQVLLFFSRAENESFEVSIEHLHLTSEGETHATGGSATTIDGVVSTRRANGSAWLDMIGKSPAGEWELALPDTAVTRTYFQDDKIGDILLVITYQGRRPGWPA